LSLEKLTEGIYGLSFGFDEIRKSHVIYRYLSQIARKLDFTVSEDVRQHLAKLLGFYLSFLYPHYERALAFHIDSEEAEITLDQIMEVFELLKILKR
jgi:HEPN domain-containing protein